MGGAFGIGRVAGIPIRVHWSLLALGALVGLTQGNGALGTILSAVLLFSSVVAHELAHALVARSYGIETHDIVLTPIGGIARLERLPSSGRAEVAIALAGPIASLLIAALAFGAGMLVAPGLGATIVGTLAWSNAMLGLFNLIPAFPLDGGRVLRGALQARIGMRAATDVAVVIGRVAAVAMGLVGLATGSFSLVLIAFFVWSAGGREQGEVAAREAMERMPRAWDHLGRALPVELVPVWIAPSPPRARRPGRW